MRRRARTVYLAGLTWTAMLRHRVLRVTRVTLQAVVGRRAIYVKLGRRTWTVVRVPRVSHASLARTRAEAM